MCSTILSLVEQQTGAAMTETRPGELPGVEWPAPEPPLPPGSMIIDSSQPRMYEGVPEAMPPVVVPARSTDGPPLAVIPLPARLEVSAAILGALADVWEREHGQTLTSEHMTTESTPWGTALVIREPRRPDTSEATP